MKLNDTSTNPLAIRAQHNGPTANRVTEDSIKARIGWVRYTRVPATTITVCTIQMVNGFSAVGHSACVDEKNFNAETGQMIAYANAFDQLWPLEGYLLAERMKQERERVETAEHGCSYIERSKSA